MKRTVVVVLCLLGLSSCSPSLVSTIPDPPGTSGTALGLDTFLKPRRAVLPITSTPPGAEARISPAMKCLTPCTLAFGAPGEYTVDVSLDGYVTLHMSVKVAAPDRTGVTLPGTDGLELEPEALSARLVPVRNPAGKAPRSRSGTYPVLNKFAAEGLHRNPTIGAATVCADDAAIDDVQTVAPSEAVSTRDVTYDSCGQISTWIHDGVSMGEHVVTSSVECEHPVSRSITTPTRTLA